MRWISLLSAIVTTVTHPSTIQMTQILAREARERDIQ